MEYMQSIFPVSVNLICMALQSTFFKHQLCMQALILHTDILYCPANNPHKDVQEKNVQNYNVSR